MKDPDHHDDLDGLLISADPPPATLDHLQSWDTSHASNGLQNPGVNRTLNPEAPPGQGDQAFSLVVQLRRGALGHGGDGFAGSVVGCPSRVVSSTGHCNTILIGEQ